jgi:hypothetical protein
VSPLAWIKIGAAALLLALVYLAGDRAGANRVIARDAKAAARIQAAGERVLKAAQAIDQAAAARDVARAAEFRSIYVEVPRVVDRPVYRNACVDADGVRLLERAVAAANGAVEPAGGGTAGGAAAVRSAPDAR